MDGNNRLVSPDRSTRVGVAVLCVAVAALAFGYCMPLASADDEVDMVELEIDYPDPCYVSPAHRGMPPAYLPSPEAPEIMVPAGTENVALGKEVTSSAEPKKGSLEQITDGEIGYEEEYLVKLPSGPQWVRIDLEQEHEISAIACWRFYEWERVYFGIVVQVSNDPEFEEGVTTIFNNDFADDLGFGEGEDREYIETHFGRVFEPGNGLSGRYVRLWSDGNNWDDYNHYIEVKVYGRPLDASGPAEKEAMISVDVSASFKH